MIRPVRSAARLLATTYLLGILVCPSFAAEKIEVNADNFPRAETDTTMAAYAKEGAFGKFMHARTPPSIDDHKVVRMNRDTLYSIGIFDLDAGPVTLTLPEAGKRYMMAQVLNQDEYTHDNIYAPQSKVYSKETIGTRYMLIFVRTLVDPTSENDTKQVHALQDQIKTEQKSPGELQLPNWDPVSQGKVRDALKVLGATLTNSDGMFGARDEVNPVHYLIGSATGWGGNPRSAAIYVLGKPKDANGKKVETVTVKDVPVDGFWSISVYNAKGFFEKNSRDAYSINNLTAKPNSDGSVTVRFGGCKKDTSNCLPTMKGWNYAARLYRPRSELISGQWTFPEPEIAR